MPQRRPLDELLQQAALPQTVLRHPGGQPRAQGGVGDEREAAGDARGVEGLADRVQRHGVPGEPAGHGHRDGVAQPLPGVDQIAVHLVRDQQPARLGGALGEPADLRPRPDPPRRVVRAAQQHQIRPRERLDGQPVAVPVPRQPHRAVRQPGGPAELLEPTPLRAREQHRQPGLGDRQQQAQRGTRAERQQQHPLRIDRHAVAPPVPVGDQRAAGRVTDGVAVRAVPRTGGEGRPDLRRPGQVHVREPHRDPALAGPGPLAAAGAPAVELVHAATVAPSRRTARDRKATVCGLPPRAVPRAPGGG